jgi:hypothetical protein
MANSQVFMRRLGVVLALQVLCSPALANTDNYTINVKGEEEEQYFITVPQDLSSTDGRLPGRLSAAAAVAARSASQVPAAILLGQL